MITMMMMKVMQSERNKKNLQSNLNEYANTVCISWKIGQCSVDVDCK